MSKKKNLNQDEWGALRAGGFNEQPFSMVGGNGYGKSSGVDYTESLVFEGGVTTQEAPLLTATTETGYATILEAFQLMALDRQGVTKEVLFTLRIIPFSGDAQDVTIQIDNTQEQQLPVLPALGGGSTIELLASGQNTSVYGSIKTLKIEL